MIMPTLRKVNKKKSNSITFVALLSVFTAAVVLHLFLITSTPACKEGIAGLFCFKLFVLYYLTPFLTITAIITATMLIVRIAPSLKKQKNHRDSTITISWLKTLQTKVPKKPSAIILVVLITLATFTPAAMQSNVLPYSLSAARCGVLPIESYRVIGVSHYRLPSDEGYGIKPTSTYTMCSQDEAEATLGYHGSEQTKALVERSQNYIQESEEAARFSPEKVSYTLYLPNPNVYTIEDLKISEIHQVNHSFYTVKKNGVVIGRVREVPIDNDYNLCDKKNNPSQGYCKPIGLSSSGVEIYREYNNTLRGWTAQYAGANIGSTGIIVTSNVDQDVIDLINAMVPYER